MCTLQYVCLRARVRLCVDGAHACARAVVDVCVKCTFVCAHHVFAIAYVHVRASCAFLCVFVRVPLVRLRLCQRLCGALGVYGSKSFFLRIKEGSD